MDDGPWYQPSDDAWLDLDRDAWTKLLVLSLGALVIGVTFDVGPLAAPSLVVALVSLAKLAGSGGDAAVDPACRAAERPRVRLQNSTQALGVAVAVVLAVAAVGLVEWRVAAFLVLPGAYALAWLYAADHGESDDGDPADTHGDLAEYEGTPDEARDRCPGCGRQLLHDRRRCDYCTVDPEWRK